MSETAPDAVTADSGDVTQAQATSSQDNPTLGQIIFIKRTDPNTGLFGVEPAIVTETYDESDGEWAQGGAVVKLRSFNPEGADTVEQQGPATYDDNDVWNGGYALTSDGAEVQSLAKQAQPTSPEVQQFTPTGGLSASQVQAMIEASNAAIVGKLETLLANLAPQQAQPSAEQPQVTDSASQSI
jgi:hypothetical protein